MIERAIHDRLTRAARSCLLLVCLSSSNADALIRYCADATYASAQPKAMSVLRDARKDLKKKKFAVALEKLQGDFCAFPAPALLRFISEAQLGLGKCDAASSSTDDWQARADKVEKPAIAFWRKQIKARCVPVTVNVKPDGVLLTIDGESQAFAGEQWTGTLTAGPHKFLLNGPEHAARTVQLQIGPHQKPISLSLTPSAKAGRSLRLFQACPDRPWETGSSITTWRWSRTAWRLRPALPR